jgi:acyl carrier protein
MQQQEIWDTLTDIFQDIFEDPDITLHPETTADDIEDWDSLTHIQLLVAIEQAFSVRFNTGEVAKLANVGEMVALIEQRTS